MIQASRGISTYESTLWHYDAHDALWHYEAHDAPSVQVDLKEKTCTCHAWQVIGLLCRHAVTTIWFRKRNLYIIIDDYLKCETFKKCYVCLVYPISNFDKPEVRMR